MVETDFTGDYVNIENCKENDIAEFLSEGSYIEQEFNGKKKQILNIPVLVNGKTKIFTPSITNGKLLVKAYGSDSAKWVGKKVKCVIVNYKSYGQTKQTIELHPLLEKVK